MDSFIRKQSSLKGQLTKLHNTVFNAAGAISAELVTIHLDKLSDLWTRSEEVNDEIVEACADELEIDEQVNRYEALYDIYGELKATLLQKQALCNPPAPTAPPSHPITSNRRVKLPSIELPKFDGQYDTWPSFQDLFSATIDSDTSLSDSEKLQYLKYSVRGEPEVLIRSLSITNSNYIQAWKILKDRYNNKREIVTSVLRRLFSQPGLTKESASSLQKLLDTTNECLSTLKVLTRPTEHWDDILVYFTVEKLDPDTRRQWAMKLSGTDLPKYIELTEFMDKHIRGLLASSSTTSVYSLNQKQIPFAKNSYEKRVSSHHSTVEFKCGLCKSDHPTYKCDKFTSVSVHERINLVKKNYLCFNCLRPDHRSTDCTSKSRCKKCKRSHHTSLHLEKKSENQHSAENTAPTSGATERSTTSLLATSELEDVQVLLSTAIATVQDSSGADQFCRVLLDSGSQATLITENCINRLGLKRSHSSVRISGISSSTSDTARGEATMKLKSTVNDKSIDITALILPKVTGTFPKVEFTQQHWNHIRGLPLADPHYYTPNRIDILIGADYLGDIMLDGKRTGQQCEPSAHNTIFGWTLSGKVLLPQQKLSVTINHVECETDKILRRFWEVEELPSEKIYSATEKLCEEHFLKTHSRNPDGRFTVELPFNGKERQLGNSRQLAMFRLRSVEKRLSNNPAFREQYNQFMLEYKQLGHMCEIPANECGDKPGKTFYLPHHFVQKLDSTSTRFRVVFDGSSKTSSGLSLNDCLMVGPTIHEDLFALLIRFRLNLIAVKADVVKMFRQFNVTDEHSNYQRILWRESPDQPIREYKLTTVTYGTASAPFSASRCLQQTATENLESSPDAAQSILRDTYVDDLMTGKSTAEEAINLRNDLDEVLGQAQLQLRKWASNSAEFLATIPVELQEADTTLSLDDSATGSIKALGVQWKTITDSFMFSVSDSKLTEKPTKRTLLSELAKVFDPLGFLTPFTIRAKLLLQGLWKLELGWDDILSNHLIQLWLDYCSEFSIIKTITIPRCILSESVEDFELHGFSDASEKAISSCAYLKSRNRNGSFTVRLVCAKSKVAPVQQVSLARLELCGALLCAELLASVKQSLNIPCETFGWTDSTIVLRWLSSFPGRWKCYIGNRVSKIQQLLPPEQWKHVPGNLNPADCASRGVSATELKSSLLWWNGPDFLKSEQLPLFTPLPPVTADLEERKKQLITAQLSVECDLFQRFSTLNKLQRVVALCLRFIKNCKTASPKIRYPNWITTAELEHALLTLIKITQVSAFSAEILALAQEERKLPSKSRLLSLAPFLDNDKILRVGGRLHHAAIPEEQKFPILLPSDHRITVLLIECYHLKYLHAGFQLLWGNLQLKFWILKPRQTIRSIVRKCIVCRRHRANAAEQMMGSLPSPRVTQAKVFSNVGVDYAGPFQLRVIKGRSNKLTKGYFVIFVCMATKAVHLEAVRDMTTEAFIAALTRFISRRGPVSNIYSDCGTNFVGADKTLQQMWKNAKHNNDIANSISSYGISWHFNSPAAPHHGGIFEAGVKSTKHHLRRVIGKSTLTYDEFETVLCQVESCLNSRPLCAMSSDPNDLSVLTPAHFLFGGIMSILPSPDFTDTKINRLSRWQLTVQMTQHFWRRWHKEYLCSLQQRFKWTTKRSNIEVGDLVLLKDENLGPTNWKLGRVVATHPGHDNLVRVVTVHTSTGDYKRPIVKLCPILKHDE